MIPLPTAARRLIRAPDLRALRDVLVELSCAGDPLIASRRAVILPTRASIELLRRTCEHRALGAPGAALLVPDFLTRDGWVARLHDALDAAGPLLSRTERLILISRAARHAARRPRMGRAPFEVRPGLASEMLRLYDELRRRRRTVGRFRRALFKELRAERGTDRGSESLIHQTAFLGFSFLEYQRLVAASGRLDEHALRDQLIASNPVLSTDHVVVAVADHPSDPRGLWPVDFDLLGRLPGIRQIDIVVTEEMHDAGFRERIEEELPGIEDTRVAPTARSSVLTTPAQNAGEALCFVSRDREEEVREVARQIWRRASAGVDLVDAPTAVVFHRPLPYLYLAGQVFGEAGIPFTTFDALPLAAEPWAAALDLVLSVARTGGTREAAVALLRSPLFAFTADGSAVTIEDASALDAVLAERRTTGEADRYAGDVREFFGTRMTRDRLHPAGAGRAAHAAAAIRLELEPFRTAPTASTRVQTIAAFVRRHSTQIDPLAPVDRDERARAAVLSVLDELASALFRHDDTPFEVDDVTALIHHAIEAETFAPRLAGGGVHLVDGVAARFGEFDHVHIVGLVDTDWPERDRRSIFYTRGLLAELGWPAHQQQRRADQAGFRDLLGLAASTLHLHAFQLEGDALLGLSPLIDEARTMPSREVDPTPAARLFADELMTGGSAEIAGLDGRTAEWLAHRRARPPLEHPRFGGFVGAQPAQAYRVSKVDRYVTCPFKYFAESVLGLPEERDDPSGLTPLERGTLLHALFERFYQAWQQERRGAITPGTLPEALELFARFTRDALARLPEADRALEEARLLGSIVARGVAERVFELEADAGVDVRDRLVEYELRGPFVFPLLHGLKQRTIEIRGKADRIDVLGDGALRVVDYKLGRLPDVESSVQIAVYAHCIRQALEQRDGRAHPVAAAMYLAFGDDRRLEGKLGGRSEPAAMAVEAGAAAFASVVEKIESGRFPPQPNSPSECQWCGFAGVCRKEYLAEDDAAESV